MLNSKPFKEWLVSKDCYGNRLIADNEKKAIKKRLKKIIKTLKIVKGDITKDQPNAILVDITHLSPKNKIHHKGKTIIITLAHYIRPCMCDNCGHEYQYECYLKDCGCCSEECT